MCIEKFGGWGNGSVGGWVYVWMVCVDVWDRINVWVNLHMGGREIPFGWVN